MTKKDTVKLSVALVLLAFAGFFIWYTTFREEPLPSAPAPQAGAPAGSPQVPVAAPVPANRRTVTGSK